jgi:2-oxoglutarate ferredoxin oxidoreductase subunit gamma
MQEEFVFSGFGGQGVMFAGQLLAYTAMDEGLEVTWIPSYGPEMRGGTAHCFVVISDKIIGSPMVARPLNGVIFNKPSFDKYEPIIAPNGRLVVNTSLVPQISTRADIELINIPATDIAYELGDQRLTNMVLLGALLRDHPVLPIEALKRALEAHIPAHRRNLLEKNFRAVERGAEVLQV